MSSKKKHAKQKLSGTHFSFGRYFIFHEQALKWSIHQLEQKALSTWVTFWVIGVALALPAVFFVLLQNAGLVSSNFEKNTQISLFLQSGETPDAAKILMEQIQVRTDVANTHYISPEEGLRDLEEQGGLSNVLEQLTLNPLPGVIEVYPAETLQSPAQIKLLLDDLKAMPGVESAKLDMLWVQRLEGIVLLGQRLVLALGLLLGLAVLLVIYHTIQLSTQNRHQEISVLTFIGATNAFIRRPFLYAGFLYGLLGSFMAWMFVETIIFSLSFSVENLAGLYQSHFVLKGLGLLDGVSLLVIGSCLGWLGSWLAVSRCIKSENRI